MRSCSIPLRAIPQKKLKIFILDMSLKTNITAKFLMGQWVRGAVPYIFCLIMALSCIVVRKLNKIQLHVKLFLFLTAEHQCISSDLLQSHWTSFLGYTYGLHSLIWPSAWWCSVSWVAVGFRLSPCELSSPPMLWCLPPWENPTLECPKQVYVYAY